MRAPRSIAAVLLAGLTVVGTAVAGSPAQAATPYHASVGTTGLDRNHRTSIGKTVTISGKVWGGPVKNQKVSIYVSNIYGVGGFERRLAVASVNAKNRYTYKWRTDDAGSFQLRVVKGAYKGHQAVKVTSKAFRVYRWADRTLPGNASGTTVDGVAQPASAHLLKPGQNTQMYNGLPTCRGMRLKVGVSDASAGDGKLVFYNAENAPPPEGTVFETNVVKGAPLRAFSYSGETAFYGSTFLADFGASPSAGDGLVLRDLQEDCPQPVKNQWNPTGYYNDEGLQYWCPGEQKLRAEDPKCKVQSF